MKKDNTSRSTLPRQVLEAKLNLFEGQIKLRAAKKILDLNKLLKQCSPTQRKAVKERQKHLEDQINTIKTIAPDSLRERYLASKALKELLANPQQKTLRFPEVPQTQPQPATGRELPRGPVPKKTSMHELGKTSTASTTHARLEQKIQQLQKMQKMIKSPSWVRGTLYAQRSIKVAAQATSTANKMLSHVKPMRPK